MDLRCETLASDRFLLWFFMGLKRPGVLGCGGLAAAVVVDNVAAAAVVVLVDDDDDCCGVFCCDDLGESCFS